MKMHRLFFWDRGTFLIDPEWDRRKLLSHSGSMRNVPLSQNVPLPLFKALKIVYNKTITQRIQK